MSDDQLFTDESDFAQDQREQEGLASQKKTVSQKAQSTPVSNVSKEGAQTFSAPSNTLLIAIVLVALALGAILGFFAGSYSTQQRIDAELQAQFEQMRQSAPSMGNSDSSQDSTNLFPEGHPDVSDMLDENGNPIQE